MSERVAAVDTATVWNAFHERLFAYVRRRVASDPDAEDIVQEVFARLQARSEQGPPVEHISGWVFEITRNAVTDYHRARATAGRTASALTRESPPALTEPSPSDDVTTELSACLRPFVERLPEPYAEALRLTDLGGMSQTDAARRLGLSVSGMKSRVQRGRAKLKQLVIECCEVQLDARRHVVDYEIRPRRCRDC